MSGTLITEELPALKPCPFCGTRANYFVKNTIWKVRCAEFGCRATVKGAWPDVAAEVWNTRPEPTP